MSKIVEGVFAIDKPPSITSAQVIRDLQHAFNKSKLFQPWMDNERAKRNAEAERQKRRRKDKRLQVKMGHGGTLDPMATGVLIIGLGKGTKKLQSFLSCTKGYEATLMFGAATNTYDVTGRLLAKAPHEHITREKVDEALEQFRSDIMQTPPIYSALRMHGKRLYEYAREGKELPTEIQARPVRVEELTLVKWHEPGAHQFPWPKEEADKDEKMVAEKVLHFGDRIDTDESTPAVAESLGGKRKRSSTEEEYDHVTDTRPPSKRHETDSEHLMSGGLGSPSRKDDMPQIKLEEEHTQPKEDEAPKIDGRPEMDESPKTAAGSIVDALPKSGEYADAPAVTLRMTVTSGFYVRSLCHDLGKALGSLGIMTSLVRTRQSDFEVGKNVLPYDDLAKGEDEWGPKVEKMLDDWEMKEQQEAANAGDGA